MGRVLKRVPLDFKWPLNKTWDGYYITDEVAKKNNFPVKNCSDCERKNGHKEDYCQEDASYCVMYNNKWRSMWYKEPPVGEGYQLWENTTEGSPVSPVFKTLEELAEYAAKNVSTFGTSNFVSKETWIEMLSDGLVYHKDGNMMFI